MAFEQSVIDLIFNAHKDDAVCLLATTGDLGPNISPKGSMIIFDDQHLAYWERSKKLALENLRNNPKVAVIYSNKGKFGRGEIPFPGGILRFYGTAEIIERGELRDKVRTMLQDREIDHAGAEEGFAVLIKLDCAEDMRGNSVM